MCGRYTIFVTQKNLQTPVDIHGPDWQADPVMTKGEKPILPYPRSVK